MNVQHMAEAMWTVHFRIIFSMVNATIWPLLLQNQDRLLQHNRKDVLD
jgi:hypothetical protein